MKILIQGTSYIGKYLIKKFLEKTQTFWVSRSNPKITNKMFTWQNMTSRSPKKNKDIDIIIHIAGASLRSENNFEHYLKGNVFMAYNLGKLQRH